MKKTIAIIITGLMLAACDSYADGPIVLTSTVAQTNTWGNLESWDMILARIASGINQLYTQGTTNLFSGSVSVTNTVGVSANVTNALSVSVTNTPSVGITNAGTTYPLAVASDTWTRPDNAEAYIAGDAITDSTSAPTLLLFDNVVDQAGKGGHIVRVQWITRQPTNTAAVRLHLFNSSDVLVPNDNAAWSVAITNLDNYVGYVDVTTMNNMGTFAYGSAVSGESKLPLAFTTAALVNDLWGLIEVKNAFTPIATQTNKVVIYVQQ